MSSSLHSHVTFLEWCDKIKLSNLLLLSLDTSRLSRLSRIVPSQPGSQTAFGPLSCHASLEMRYSHSGLSVKSLRSSYTGLYAQSFLSLDPNRLSRRIAPPQPGIQTAL